jgi:hypothetical protein
MEHAQRHMAEHIHRIPEEDFQKCLEAWKKKMEENIGDNENYSEGVKALNSVIFQ